MGLGKTIMCISLLAHLGADFKYLIVVPKSCIPNWKKEFRIWLPEFRVVNLIPIKGVREKIIKEDLRPGKFEVCLTTFEGARICVDSLKIIKWEYLIVDEAHKLKNQQSKLSLELRKIPTQFRLLMTGTPLQNNLTELWALLNFIFPTIFSEIESFNEIFDLAKQEESKEKTEDKNISLITQLHQILKPFLLRRIKKEVAKELPPKTELHIKV